MKLFLNLAAHLAAGGVHVAVLLHGHVLVRCSNRLLITGVSLSSWVYIYHHGCIYISIGVST